MKNRIIALVLTLALALVCLCSCNLIFGEVSDSGDVTVVVRNADGTDSIYKADLEKIENKSEGGKGVLEHLQKNDKNPLHVEMVDSTYGVYVSAIGSISESPSDGSYVMVYTSVKTDSYEGAPTVSYEGVTLYQSGVGLSGMTVESGCVILFLLETYSY